MKRVFRIFAWFTIALSLVLSLALGALWVHGYWASDHWELAYTWDAPTRGDPGRAWYQRALYLWSQGGRVEFQWSVASGRQPDILLSDDGEEHVEVYRPTGWSFIHSHGPPIPSPLAYPAWPAWQKALGLGWYKEAGTTDHETRESWSLILPAWLLFLMVGLPGFVLGVGRWRRAHHQHRCRRLGLCPTCNYDLRASPERCPECGTTRTFKGPQQMATDH
jgi:hypothetical protein